MTPKIQIRSVSPSFCDFALYGTLNPFLWEGELRITQNSWTPAIKSREVFSFFISRFLDDMQSVQGDAQKIGGMKLRFGNLIKLDNQERCCCSSSIWRSEPNKQRRACGGYSFRYFTLDEENVFFIIIILSYLNNE